MAGAKRKKAAKKKPGKRRSFFARRILRALDLPEETAGDVLKLTAVGGTDLLVENHAGVLRYDAKSIRLLAYGGALEIEGEGLELSELAAGRAYVKGRLALIRFTT